MAKSDLHENIRNRWSPYQFSERPLDPEKLKLVLEAAIYAPSSFNEQPWLFVYTDRDDTASFKTFLSFLEENNRIWASQAWALVVTLARTKSSFNKRENPYALHDTGMAVGNILNQATSMGIEIHIMGGFSRQKVREYLKLDDDIVPVSIMAIGYAGENSQIGEEISDRDKKRRGRKAFEEVIIPNNHQNPALKRK
jgi:nitroreductase